MRLTWLLPLFLLTSPVSADVRRPLSPLTSEIVAASDVPLPDCGIAGTPGELEAARSCVDAAVRNNRPFVIQFRMEGIDSVVWQAAIQLPSGRRMLLQHDSFGEGRITRETCQTFSFTDTLLPIGCEH
ncbi:MAG: hypothetical protein GXC75_11035 [Xanthomonadaceae bacterium]|nr:hypothetical protein [Xanthomonadaceae bacterium]